jgi:hypothetical protein
MNTISGAFLRVRVSEQNAQTLTTKKLIKVKIKKEKCHVVNHRKVESNVPCKFHDKVTYIIFVSVQVSVFDNADDGCRHGENHKARI